MTTPPIPSAESIESLRQALRALVQEVCDHLKDVEIPVCTWTRVVHEEDLTKFPTEEREDLSDLAYRICPRDVLDKLETFRSTVKLIQQDPALAENLLLSVDGAPIGRPERQCEWIKMYFIPPFLHTYFTQVQGVSFEKGAFRRSFQLLASELQAGIVSATWLTPLINLRISTENVKLGNQLRLRSPCTDELERWANTSAFALPVHPYGVAELHCAIELDFEYSWPSQPPTIEADETNNRLLNTLRLLVDYNICIAFSEKKRQGILWRYTETIGWMPSYRRYLPPFVLDADGAERLKKLWRSIVDGPNKEKVQLALKRFGDTAERLSTEDKLIDYWIALESLFAPESSSEIRYRAALRIASFLGEGEDSTKIYRDVGLSYDFRSAVVHANRRRLANLEKKATLADITERTRGYLRRALLKVLESDEVFDPRNIEHELLSR